MRKKRKQTLDDTLREGLYQRTYGPHKPGALSSLEQWERLAATALLRFTEREVPDENVIGFPVCGRWRFFEASTEEIDNKLSRLSIAFNSLSEAFQYHDELSSSPSVEAAEKFAIAAMRATYFAVEANIAGSRTWLDGLAVQDRRELGGKGKRRFKTIESKQAAVAIVNRFLDPPRVKLDPACARAVPVVRDELGIEANAKTIKRLWQQATADNA